MQLIFMSVKAMAVPAHCSLAPMAYYMAFVTLQMRMRYDVRVYSICCNEFRHPLKIRYMAG